MTDQQAPPSSARTTLYRLPDRGTSDPARIRAILADGVFCHVAIIDSGCPVVIPMAYGLQGDEIIVHGVAAGRLLRSLRSGAEVCAAVTLFDGLVLARSAFEHSMNYRSVVVFGRARWIRDASEKVDALRSLSEQALPGRWDDVRPPTSAELNQTHVFGIPITEGSAKVRSGPPSADEDSWPTWTGVLPNRVRWAAPVPEPGNDRPAPTYLTRPRRTSDIRTTTKWTD